MFEIKEEEEEEKKRKKKKQHLKESDSDTQKVDHQIVHYQAYELPSFSKQFLQRAVLIYLRIDITLAVYMHPDPSSDINTDILTEEISKSSSDLRNDKSIFQVIFNYKGEVSIFLDAVSVLIMLKENNEV
jgi:hypothetical protein